MQLQSKLTQLEFCDLLKAAGFDVASLKFAGFDAAALKAAGFDAASLKNAGSELNVAYFMVTLPLPNPHAFAGCIIKLPQVFIPDAVLDENVRTVRVAA
jgi:hypothetical protein